MCACGFVVARAFKMLSVFLQRVRDISVVRRIRFPSTFFPREVPNYWQAVAEFGLMNRPSRNDLTSEQVKLFVENVDVETFITENELFRKILCLTLEKACLLA